MLWDAQGALAQYLHRLFGQNENFNENVYRQKGDHYYIQGMIYLPTFSEI